MELAAAAAYSPVACVNAPAPTLTTWAVGVPIPETFSNETLYDPGGIDCHMPQSSLGTPSTEIVAASEGFVRIRREPCTVKAASYVVV